MGELRPVLEDIRNQMQPDDGAFERVAAFRRRRRTRQRVAAGTLALLIAGVTFVALANAFKQPNGAKPGASAPTTSIEPSSPAPLTRYLSPAFWGPDTWHTTGSGDVERGQAATAWASSIAFDPADLASSGVPAIPVKTIQALPADGMVLTAEVTPWAFDPVKGPYPPGALEPLDLSRATLRARQGEEPPGPYSVLELDTPYVLIRVYVNSPAPSSGLISRAQAELDTLQIPPVCPGPQSGPFGATPDKYTGAPGDTVRISGPMPFQREDGSFDQSGTTRMIAWWNAAADDWPLLSSFSTVSPSPVGPGPVLRLGEGGLGACSFAITFVVPNVAPGDYPIDILQEGGGSSTLEATFEFRVLSQ